MKISLLVISMLLSVNAYALDCNQMAESMEALVRAKQLKVPQKDAFEFINGYKYDADVVTASKKYIPLIYSTDIKSPKDFAKAAKYNCKDK